mmetsp:Transcript_36615/g.88442  ORF Transcript_36615/g.88442 Transcript_36615/m.88442 type:complete len:290 (-) Transcript_36615:2212-3081(-)
MPSRPTISFISFSLLSPPSFDKATIMDPSFKSTGCTLRKGNVLPPTARSATSMLSERRIGFWSVPETTVLATSIGLSSVPETTVLAISIGFSLVPDIAVEATSIGLLSVPVTLEIADGTCSISGASLKLLFFKTMRWNDSLSVLSASLSVTIGSFWVPTADFCATGRSLTLVQEAGILLLDSSPLFTPETDLSLISVHRMDSFGLGVGKGGCFPVCFFELVRASDFELMGPVGLGGCFGPAVLFRTCCVRVTSNSVPSGPAEIVSIESFCIMAGGEVGLLGLTTDFLTS